MSLNMSFSIVYIVLVVLKAVLVYIAMYPPQSKRGIIISMVVFLGPAVMEFPLLIILFKLITLCSVLATKTLVLLPLTIIALSIDILTIVALYYVFFIGYKSRGIVHQHTLEFEAHGPSLPDICSSYFWFRIMAPLYVSFNIVCIQNIPYATSEELIQAGDRDAKYLKLDLYRRKSTQSSERNPVLIFIHGGSWSAGDKSLPYPQIRYLASHGWIVVSINYRLKNYPTHLIDCKRAVRWVRENIHNYGGDENFICVSGESAGAHLASIVALTPNDPKYQPGFENVSTVVKACVAINGVFDITNSHGVWGIGTGIPDWFARRICGLETGISDPDTRKLLEEASPELIVRKRDVGLPIVPFMVFHGESDNLVPVEHTREFVKTFRQHAGHSKIVYVEYPGGHHGYHLLSAPKTHYQMIGMLRFLNWVWDNNR